MDCLPGTETFVNAYEDTRRAAAYARLEFAGTYHLAYRDLPEIVARHVRGRDALDFGCGTGRSTRFLRRLGFDVTGVDIAVGMLAHARAADPSGDYRLVAEGDLGLFPEARFDLALSAFTFDNIPTRELKVRLCGELRRVLRPRGRLINVVSSPELYLHEWASFSTAPFPENQRARPGDTVRTIITDIADARPVDDVLWPDAEYRAVYAEAGLAVEDVWRPLARGDEPTEWVNETRIAPWTIYVLGSVRAGAVQNRGSLDSPGHTGLDEELEVGDRRGHPRRNS